ncbi:MAG: histidinol-phosphate aminotransferase family protein [Anaerotignum sp.]|nr:histidinol-phosphate aminotransferase family protein [Anaerotignum sp.]
MELRINSIIKAHTKISYAVESEGPRPFDIDCAEGSNIVSNPPAAVEAFKDLKYELIRMYPHSMAAKDSIIEYWKDYAKLNYKNITLCDGSISGLYLINRLFLEKGDRVLGYVPTFSDYAADVIMHGCEYDGIVLKPENNYKFDADELIAALTAEHKLIYIDNPNNPTGQVMPLADIEKILQAAEKLGVTVIIDEAYGEYMPKENSAVKLFEKYDNLLVPKTFSKGFGLAGLRAGYILMPEVLNPYMTNITNPYCMSELSRVVAAKVIKDEAFLTELMDDTAKLKKMMLEYPWKNLYAAETADTCSICLLFHKNPEVDLAEEFLKHRILVYSGVCYDTITKNGCRFRVPAAEDMPAVMEAMKAIDAID